VDARPAGGAHEDGERVTTYQVRGEVPAKRHTQLWRDGRLLTEEVVGAEGFGGLSTILYHLHSPMRVLEVGAFRPIVREEWVPEAHVHHRFDAWDVDAGGDAVSSRRVLAFNEDVEVAVARPDRAMSRFYRDAEADELVFVHEGEGVVETMLGAVPYRPGDYVLLPRGLTYRFRPAGAAPERHLVLTTTSPLEIPARYRNAYGQLVEEAPYHHRDLHAPVDLMTHDEHGRFDITVRVRGGLQDYVLPSHPFDVVGWDGYLYPYTLNVDDLEPVVKAVHAPPTVHQTFEAQRATVCTFAPRPLDWHPQAVPIPYNHANLDSEELIYYVSGDFSSRRGVAQGSLTLHPTGLTHGPQPGLAEASLGAQRTQEVAVMLDTFRPLRLTAAAAALDAPEYATSWNEAPVDA
jgi:homogentisate 1,2-dioxygenase